MSPTALATLPSSCPVVPLPPFGSAAARPRAASSSSNTTSTECTLTTSPTAPRVSRIRPERGAAIVTVALSVITSTIGSSSVMVWPGSMSQLTISPSVTPSPMSGSLNSYLGMGSSVPCCFDDRGQDAVRQRQVFHFQAVGKGRIEPRDPNGRRFEVEERFLVDERDDLASKSTGAGGLMNDHHPARLLDAGDDGLQVYRPQ